MSSKRSLSIAIAALAVIVVLGVLWSRATSDDSQAAIARSSHGESVVEATSTSLDAQSAASSTVDARTTATPVIELSSATKESNVASNASDETDATLIVRCVSKPTGKPLAGVRVYVARKDMKGPRSAKHVTGNHGSLSEAPLTADDGEVEMALPSGCELFGMASARELGAGDVELSVPALAKDERRVIVVEHPVGDDARFDGIVLASETKAPIANARVLLMQSTGWSSIDDDNYGKRAGRISETTTGSDGRFELSIASWMHPYVRIDADGFGTVLASPSANHSSPDTADTIVLEPGANIDATVFDSSGAALAGADVIASAAGYMLTRGESTMEYDSARAAAVVWSATTAADGRCTLKGLTPRVALTIVIKKERKVLQKDGPKITLEPNEARAIEFRIGSGCTLNGLLVDEKNAPVSQRAIWLMRADASGAKYFQMYERSRLSAKTISGDDGRFSLRDVSAGSWWIGPAPLNERESAMRADVLAPLADTIEVQPGAHEMEIVVKSKRGLWIRGRVVAPDGTPKAHASVWTTDEDDTRGASTANADEAGNFALGPLVAGRYTLAADGWGLECSSQPIVANAGDDGVILKLRAGGIIEGKVVGPSGEAMQADIVYQKQLGSDDGRTTTGTQPDGSFELQGLEPGVYDVMARAQGARIAVAHGIAVGAGVRVKGIVLTTEAGAKLKIRYEGKSEEIWFEVRSDGVVIATDSASNKGPASEQAVPKGHLTVEVHHFEGGLKTGVRAVDVAAGEEKEVVLTDE